MREVEAVCDDISKQYSALSFHVRFEYIVYRRYGGYYAGNNHNHHHHRGTSTHTTNYIEVNIADVESRGDMGIASAPPLVTASLVGGTEKSAAERLSELDNIRGMLSEEEYERKRKEILDSL